MNTRRALRIFSLAWLLTAIICFPDCKDRSPSKSRIDPHQLNSIDHDFLYACRQGDIGKAQRCLQRGANILVCSNYRSALFSAIDGGRLDVMTFLLEKEKKLVRIPNEYGVSPLGYILRGDGNFIQGDETALRIAALHLLIDSGADVHEKNEYGLTDLFYVSGNDAPAMIEVLLSSGADMNQKSSTPYPDSFCDVDFALPAGSTALDEFEALLEVIPSIGDFDSYRKVVGETIRVLKKHGAVNGAWAAQKRSSSMIYSISNAATASSR